MTPRRRVLPAATMAGALVLAACGGGSSGSESAAPGTDAPLPAPTATGDVFDEVADPEPVDAEPVAEEPAAELPAATNASSVDVTAPTDDQDDTVAEPEPEPAAEPAPVVTPAEIGGRAFAADVQAASDFDGNPFPDLVVDDIGRDAQANIRNILPSDRPVLLWTWAPH